MAEEQPFMASALTVLKVSGAPRRHRLLQDDANYFMPLTALG